MAGLDAAGVLRAWELGRGQSPAERALILLGLGTGRGRDELVALPVTERDAALLAVRAATFGPRMEARVDCPACAEGLEFDLDIPNLVPPADGLRRRQVTREGQAVEFRLPTSDDLLAAAAAADVDEARQLLGRRCVVAVDGAGELALPDRLPDWLVDEVSAAMADEALAVSLSCPACGHGWSEAVDAAAFVWEEVQGEAKRLLHEVVALAAIFGWREADILAMSAARRRAYLELAG